MKILKILFKTIAFLLVVLLLTYLLGPKPNYPSFNADIPELTIPLNEIDNYLAKKESTVENLKPNNHSRIVWLDSLRKTNYVLLYLHGFSASPMEGDPTHEDFAKRYGCNLYIPRLAQHGIKDENIFKELTPKDLIDSAKEAVAIARLLGDTVILMSCSTGSTLGNYLAAEHPDAFHGHIMYSPNIDLVDPRSDMLTKPWGLQLARHLIGENRNLDMLKGTPKEQYTTISYKVEGLICLKSLIQSTMTEATFKKIKTPYLIGYYYKDENQHDNIISIDAIKQFHSLSGTAANKKQLIAMPDVRTHVIPSDLYCKDLANVKKVTYDFAEDVLGLVKVNKSESIRVLEKM